MAAVVMLMLAGVGLGSTPADGHEGTGALEVVAADPAAPLEVRYRVRLSYVADGHPVDDATVTAVAEDAAGQETVPAPMTGDGEPGMYAGVVRFREPGSWTVRFTSVTPPATVERPEVVAPPTTTTSTTGAPTTTVASSRPGKGDVGDAGSGGRIAGGVALLLAIAFAMFAARRRSRRGPG